LSAPTDASAVSGRDYHWQCYKCAPVTSYRFSHIAGTIFENTNKPLREWFKVVHLMLTNKEGISARRRRAGERDRRTAATMILDRAYHNDLAYPGASSIRAG
jgi:hypothetical protein